MPIVCPLLSKAHAPEKENHVTLPKSHPNVNIKYNILFIFFVPGLFQPDYA